MPQQFQKLVALAEELIRLEKTRTDHQKNIEDIVDSMTDGFWDWHITTNYEFMPKRFWEILGYDHTQKKHEPSEWLSILHPEDIQGIQEKLQAHFASKGSIPFICEARYFKPDGSIAWILCRGAVVEWDGDQPIRMVGCHSDITPLKEKPSV